MIPTASLLSHPTSTKHRDHAQNPSLFAIESLLYSSDNEDVSIFFGVKEEKKITTIEAPPQHTPLVAEKRRFNRSNARMTLLENIGSTKSEMPRSVSYCIGHKGPMLREHTHTHADADTHMGMHRSLTDDDFFELKGCIDLGFRFDEASIPQLSHILPALEVCSAITQNFHEHPITISPPPWKVTNPGDSPDDVKERLRHWAQAVACNLRLCH